MQIGNLSLDSSTADSVINLLSVTVAVIALFASLVLDRATRRREDKFVQGNVKPLLAVRTINYTNAKAVILENYGTGTAVITDISISKNGVQADQNNLASLLFTPSDLSFQWNNFAFFTQKTEYMRAGECVDLARLTVEGLIGTSPLSKAEAEQMLTHWDEELVGVEIRIAYKDILGNRQPIYERIFENADNPPA